ncbi:MAG: putative peroxiredoxin bcp [Alphaproteobacteria bacterium MarineAlpha8_Bin1]|nr:MAG: putative peroxiredoxin bcp [Alphaproteobacteria bacterium MarineAlpha8_Bin1]|tara:strand:+ start:72 stop:530 length:459 start_codon:yes stop_codon:yes gene_type:complete
MSIKKLPNIKFLVADDSFISKEDLLGKFLVIYFYPKDDTPGCTKEAIDFSSFKKKFDKIDTNIIGISRDNLNKHQKFKEKHSINFELATDEDGKICEQFGVWVEKSMYGRKYMGIERSTFVFDKDLKLINSWRNVKVKDHALDVYNFLSKLV